MGGSNSIDWQVKGRPLTAHQAYCKRRRERAKALGILAENGFREAISPLEIEWRGKRSRQRWLRLRKDINHALLASPLGI
jgi:hypothetical protein